MKVFISWSGDTSQKIARVLRDWLPTVIHYVEPWVSSEDIKKGDRWSLEVSKQLDETSFGIICIDATNSSSPWLNFEAGALSKSLENGKIFPVLFGVKPTDIKGPLAQFQLTLFEKEDFYRLVKSINLESSSSKIDPERLLRSFEIAWTGLLNTVNHIQSTSQTSSNSKAVVNVDQNTNKNTTFPNSLKDIKIKIVYIDTHAENAVKIKKLMLSAGCSVVLELIRTDDYFIAMKERDGTLYYRTPELLESAIDAKNLSGELGVKKVASGTWDSTDTDLVLWLTNY